ncbi:MAG: hypothetical protein J7J06_06285 [Methanosarcinales archaeon]|nr:hypothetical protein [Methanosarcinales archaeon]
MNKNNRRILPTMVALLVMAMMCAVATAAVAPEISKTINTTQSDPEPYTYDVYTGTGSTIVYDITVSRDSALPYPVNVQSVTDTMPCPGGVPQTLTPPSLPYDLYPGDVKQYTSSHTLTAADVVGLVVGQTTTIRNRAEVSGVELDPDWAPNYEQVGAYAEKTITVRKIDTTPTPTPTYSTPPTDVPAQTPLGIVALIGLLGLIGAGMIIGRK